METKFVIVMHNRDEHIFEESELLDGYPPPETIEWHLRQSEYNFAKVEKRYSLSFEEAKKSVEEKSESFAYLRWYDDDGIIHIQEVYSLEEYDIAIAELDKSGINYHVTLPKRT